MIGFLLSVVFLAYCSLKWQKKPLFYDKNKYNPLQKDIIL